MSYPGVTYSQKVEVDGTRIVLGITPFYETPDLSQSAIGYGIATADAEDGKPVNVSEILVLRAQSIDEQIRSGD